MRTRQRKVAAVVGGEGVEMEGATGWGVGGGVEEGIRYSSSMLFYVHRDHKDY